MTSRPLRASPLLISNTSCFDLAARDSSRKRSTKCRSPTHSGTPLPRPTLLRPYITGSLRIHAPTYNAHCGYLAFLGQISPEKRPDRAIEIARAIGIPLKLAAKIDKVDEGYFREVVAPLLNGSGVEFIGEINERSKTRFLGEAAALLFPIDWPEPFGLVMIEAMACGTPILAFRHGAAPEIHRPRRDRCHS